MNVEENLVFQLSIGGFPGGWQDFSIIKIKSGYKGKFSKLPDCCECEFPVSDEDVRALEDCLTRIGAASWLESYCNFNVLDGIEWNVFCAGKKHSGSNAYPEGFKELLTFLADRFGYESLKVIG